MTPNLVAQSNVFLEYLDNDGNVLHAENNHNLVVNGGLEWIMRLIFGRWTTEGPPAPLPNGTNLFVAFGEGDNGSVYIPIATQDKLRDTTSIIRVSITRDDVTFTPPGSIVIDKTIDATDAPTFYIKEIGVFMGDPLLTNTALYEMIAVASGPPNYDNTGEAGAALGPIHVRILYQLINAA